MKRQSAAGAFFLFFIFSGSFAEADPVRLKTRVSPSQVTVGDEIRYTVTFDIPDGSLVEPFLPNQNLSPFELKKTQTFSSVKKRGSTVETRVLILTVFEWGDLAVPPVAFTVKDSRGFAEQIFTSPQRVKVVSVPRRATDRDDIRPIKGPVSMGLGFYRDLAFAFLAVLLAVYLAVQVILRRRQKALEDLESLKTPEERAALELGRLKAKGFLEAGKIKAYYSELVDILRRYLERRFGVETFELTTAEILGRLKGQGFDRILADRMKEIFENADLVKFAKAVPPQSVTERLTAQLISVVEETTPRKEP